MEDSSPLSWLCEMGLESSVFMDDCMFNEDEVALLQQDLETCLSSNQPEPELELEPDSDPHPPTKTKKTKRGSFQKNQSRAPVVISFGNEDAGEKNGRNKRMSGEEEEEEQLNSKNVQKSNSSSRVRPPSQTYDHIIAERKRREQMSQRFVTLSTIVPGIKKMDKTSVLGSVINYMKHLQERVKSLEEEAMNQTSDSLTNSKVVVRKSCITSIDSDDNFEQTKLPEVDAKIMEPHVFVRIQCEIEKGVLVNLLSQVEDLNLAVISINLTCLGGLALDITITTEMEKDFDATEKQIVKRLRGAVQGRHRFMNEYDT